MRLKQLREANGMSQYRLAKISGVNQPNISKMEANGNRGSANGDTLRKLAVALGCSIEDILDPIPQEMVKTG